MEDEHKGQELEESPVARATSKARTLDLLVNRPVSTKERDLFGILVFGHRRDRRGVWIRKVGMAWYGPIGYM